MTSPSSQKSLHVLQQALDTEYAIIYCYGLISAYTAPEFNELVTTSLSQHRHNRQSAIQLLTTHGYTAQPAASAYKPEQNITNSQQAINLALILEQHAQRVWRSVVEYAIFDDVRHTGLIVLTETASLEAQWNMQCHTWPLLSHNLPGQPQ